MDLYQPRKLKFKAWNLNTSLLMRLDSISCAKGELFKQDHILLQYTGLLDKQLEELYEMDLVFIGSSRYVIAWCATRCCWCYGPLAGNENRDILTKETAQKMIRLCSYFESGDV
jgi:sulfatase maturation enzyme AslB (radical SAM superfamily)